jgi:hypothetical protein
MIEAFVIVAGIWAVATTHFRYVAARERAGAGKPWFATFMGTGWLSTDTTDRGNRYRRMAVTSLWLGPVLIIGLFAVAGATGACR